MLSLDIASPIERERLGALRAEAWGGALTEAQFLERNRRLYQHDYGKNKITTYVLRNDAGAICASMDVLQVPLLYKSGEGVLALEGGLIASVITAPRDRRKGYASQLLTQFRDQNPNWSGVLYSDIGPPFYERFGFRATLVRVREEPAIVGRSLVSALAYDEGVSCLARAKRESLQRAAGPAATLFTDALWLDWHIERYRYFAELSQRVFPAATFYEVSHPEQTHFLFALPNHPYGRLEVLWIAQGCRECEAAVKTLSGSLGLKKTVWWSEDLSSGSGKTECPMMRLAPSFSEPRFVAPQLCDWW